MARRPLLDKEKGQKRSTKKPKWRVEKFLFRWSNIPGNKKEEKNLLDYIFERYEIKFKDPKIEKEGTKIKISDKKSKNFATISIVDVTKEKKDKFFNEKGEVYEDKKVAQLRINKGIGEDLIVAEEENDYKISASLIVIENVVASILFDFTGVKSEYIITEKHPKAGEVNPDTGEAYPDTINVLNITKLKEKYPEFQYKKERFPGVVWKLGNKPGEPDLALLIFKSGSVICTGAGKEEYVFKAKEILKNKFKELGIHLKKEPTVIIQNIVASTKIYPNINLDVLCEDDNTEYEPEQFPGLIYNLDDPETVMMIFRSGRIVVTGAKSTNDAILAAKKTKDLIRHMDALIYE